MAFKLFYERKKSKLTEKILKESLSSIKDAIFISDASGSLIEFNSAFAEIQGFSNKSECIDNLEDYPDYFEVYKSDGQFAELKDWALPKALKGESSENEKYYIRRKSDNDIWIGHYSYNPIKDESNGIV